MTSRPTRGTSPSLLDSDRSTYISSRWERPTILESAVASRASLRKSKRATSAIAKGRDGDCPILRRGFFRRRGASRGPATVPSIPVSLEFIAASIVSDLPSSVPPNDRRSTDRSTMTDCASLVGGKPAGAPGLAEYFEDVGGVCVKKASYVTRRSSFFAYAFFSPQPLVHVAHRATSVLRTPSRAGSLEIKRVAFFPLSRKCLPYLRLLTSDRPSPPMHSFFGGSPILPESAGYGIVLGFGIFFSIFTTTLVRPPLRHAGSRKAATKTRLLRERASARCRFRECCFRRTSTNSETGCNVRVSM